MNCWAVYAFDSFGMFSIQRSTITIETARKYICRPSILSQKKHPMNSIQLQILFWELKKISKEIVNKSRVHCSYTIYYIIPKYLCILILCTYLNLESSLNVNILRCLLLYKKLWGWLVESSTLLGIPTQKSICTLI